VSPRFPLQAAATPPSSVRGGCCISWRTVNPVQRGRPPLPAGTGQEERLSVRVRPATKATFTALAQAKGITVSAAHRQALAQWMARESKSA
jgi:hypothetical protein